MSIPRAVKEWLAEFKALPENEVHSYANTIRHNEDLVTGLYYLFEHASSEEILDPVCHQLFEFYRSSEASLRLFSLDFIPVLIWLYLSSLSIGGKKSCGGVEAFLLGVYNLIFECVRNSNTLVNEPVKFHKDFFNDVILYITQSLILILKLSFYKY